MFEQSLLKMFGQTNSSSNILSKVCSMFEQSLLKMFGQTNTLLKHFEQTLLKNFQQSLLKVFGVKKAHPNTLSKLC